MDPQLAELIKETINTRAKFDVVGHFHRNPYTWESLRGLAQRLHRVPEDLQTALRELSRAGLLEVSGGHSGSGELLYSYQHQCALATQVQLLMAEFAGAGKAAVVAALTAADTASRLRELQRKRNLDDIKTRFVAMVTHELRTPVTAIVNLLTALQADREFSPVERQQMLQRATRQAERLTVIIENLLVLSGLQNNTDLELYLAEVDLRRLVTETALDWRDTETVGRLQLNLDEAPASVEADEYLLGEVFRELIANGLKFSPEGEVVTVTVGQREGQLYVTVADQGSGLPASQRDKVFEVFYQAEEDSSRSLGGLGLGLYMAKRIVEAHRGRIWVQPQPSPGTCICFTLPLSRSSA